MAKIILYSAISLDYKIARADGSIDWLHDPAFAIEGEDFGYQAFYDSVGYTLMGNNTYRQILAMDIPFPYPNTENYVFSRFKDTRDTEYVKFAQGKVLEFVPKLKAKAEKDIWLIGGAQINGLLLRAGLIDELILTCIPVIIGEGIPLFSGQGIQSKWKLKGTRTYSNSLVQLTYSFIPSK
jgi:dihydrofolate reductase